MKNSWGTKISGKERLLPYMNSSSTHGVCSTYQVVLSLESVVYSKLLMLKSMWCGKAVVVVLPVSETLLGLKSLDSHLGACAL